MKARCVVTACLALVVFASPSHAQLAVVDPVNLIQNILTAARALILVENQIRQLENEAQMLTNDAKNLEYLDFNALNRIRATLATSQRLFDEARGLAFELGRAQEAFARLYPEEYGEAVTREQIMADRHEQWTNARNAVDTALQVQAQAKQNIPEDESILADVVERSRVAVGALQAAQATNQLLALQSRQLMQSQQLATSQDRAIALEHARSVAAEERSRELRRRFMSEETIYTADPVEMLKE